MNNSSIGNMKQTTIMMSTNRLTILEEDDDDLQSMGGSKYNKKTFMNDRERIENFSFKMQSDDAVPTNLNTSPNKTGVDKFIPQSTSIKQTKGSSSNNNAQTMSTAT